MNEEILSTIETFFMAFADKTRLRLLNLMRDGEVCVCFFVEILGISQPKISRHLAYLRNAGIVEARRDGKWMHYQIISPEDETSRRVLSEILDWLSSQDQMKEDTARYDQVCCSPDMLVQIARTPINFILAKANMNDEKPDNYQPFYNEIDEFLL